MNKVIGAIALILVIIGGYLWFEHSRPARITTDTVAADASAPADLGTYSYECDEHVSFTMTPAADMQTIAIAPNGASASYPPAVTLAKQTATSGVRYEGGGVVFTAHGETVVLGEGESAITCSPVQNPDMAPFNFGD